MFVCIQIDPTKPFKATFVHLWFFENYWAEIQKVDIFATFRTYWAEVLKDPRLAEI